MKTLIIYYSLKGHSEKIAKEKAAQASDADIFQIKDVRKHGMLWAFTRGMFKAIKRRKTRVQPINVDFAPYEKIIIVMPIWAESPAPAFNNLADLLPMDKQIELIMTSGSGKSNQEATKQFLQNKGITLSSYTDIKTGKEKQK